MHGRQVCNLIVYQLLTLEIGSTTGLNLFLLRYDGFLGDSAFNLVCFSFKVDNKNVSSLTSQITHQILQLIIFTMG